MEIKDISFLKKKEPIKYTSVGLNDIFPLKKYFGLTVKEIIEKDYNYIDKLIKKSPVISFDKEVKEVIINIIKDKKSIYKKIYFKDLPIKL